MEKDTQRTLLILGGLFAAGGVAYWYFFRSKPSEMTTRSLGTGQVPNLPPPPAQGNLDLFSSASSASEGQKQVVVDDTPAPPPKPRLTPDQFRSITTMRIPVARRAKDPDDDRYRRAYYLLGKIYGAAGYFPDYYGRAPVPPFPIPSGYEYPTPSLKAAIDHFQSLPIHALSTTDPSGFPNDDTLAAMDQYATYLYMQAGVADPDHPEMTPRSKRNDAYSPIL